MHIDPDSLVIHHLQHWLRRALGAGRGRLHQGAGIEKALRDSPRKRRADLNVTPHVGGAPGGLLRGFQLGLRQRQPGARLLHLRLGDVQVLAGQQAGVLIVYALQAPVGCLLQFERGLFDFPLG